MHQGFRKIHIADLYHGEIPRFLAATAGVDAFGVNRESVLKKITCKISRFLPALETRLFVDIPIVGLFGYAFAELGIPFGRIDEIESEYVAPLLVTNMEAVTIIVIVRYQPAIFILGPFSRCRPGEQQEYRYDKMPGFQ